MDWIFGEYVFLKSKIVFAFKFFCVCSAESLAFRGAGFTCAGFTGADKLGIGEGCGIVLRIPHDTKAGVVVKADGLAGGAQRRAAKVGDAVPRTAAHQTDRPSRGSCGVGHAC